MVDGHRGGNGASKLERAYDTILSNIQRGSYGPGYRLVIDELARGLDMSQVPVREAIRRLEAEGWVTFERYVGARVAPADPDGWEHLLQVLAVLEGAAAALAAERLEQDDLNRLRYLNQAMAGAVRAGDMVAFGRLNREFHERIDAHCPNPVLVSMAQDIWLRLYVGLRTVFVYIPDRPRDAVGEHERIVELLARRAPAAEIEQEMREHKLRTLGAIQNGRTTEIGRPAVP